MERINVCRYDSPVGEMIVGSFHDRICICDWVRNVRRDIIDRRICRQLDAAYKDCTSDVIVKAAGQLDEYFAGRRTVFSVPVIMTGTEFQCRVWRQLQTIGYGATVSYAALARLIGNPAAVRAVATAVANNPISILVPCHRVIGSDNSLTGYAGGIEAKRRLLTLEAHMAAGH